MVSFDRGLALRRRPAARQDGHPPPDATTPRYLREVYSWAYLNPRYLQLLDRAFVVSTILWGHYGLLLRSVLAELRPGQSVLQPACVYGDFSPRLAAHLGPQGRLAVHDVALLQVENCRRKLVGFPQASVSVRNAIHPHRRLYDAVCCFFLLHELPETYKHLVVEALLGSVAPGGKVVFVDYHAPHRAHPLAGVMSLVFDRLEPFAKDLWRHQIASYATTASAFHWSTQTFFGGLYQKTVAQRHAGAADIEADRGRSADWLPGGAAFPH